MRVVCPKCQFNGLVDHGKSTARIRVICVQCATTFDAVVTDDGAQTVRPSPNGKPLLKQIAAQDFKLLQSNSPVIDIHPVASQPPRMFYETREPTSLGEAALLAPPKHLLPSATEKAAVTHPVEIINAPQVVEVAETQEVEAIEVRPVEESEVLVEAAFTDVWTDAGDVEKALPASFTYDQPEAPPTVKPSGSPVVAAENSFEFINAVKTSVPPPPDKYRLGVRLMRVSPLWLLVCGLGLVSTMVFFNWIKKPSEVGGDVTINLAPLRKVSTNESVAPATTAPAPLQQAEPATPPPTTPPVVAEQQQQQQSAPVVPAVQSVIQPALQNDGRFTVQIGSFKEASEAEKIVETLRSGGFEARAEQAEVPKRGVWHRVYAGQFGDRAEALRYAAELRSKGLVQNTIVAEIAAR